MHVAVRTAADLATGLGALGEDDWLHLRLSLPDVSDDRHVTDTVADSPVPVSATILSDRSDDWEPDWDAGERLLSACGTAGGFVLLPEDVLWHLCGEEPADTGAERVGDAVEVAASWADVHGLAFVVVTGPWGAVAAKPDGRAERCPGPCSTERDVDLVRAYVADPSDLAAALAGLRTGE